jgi:DNA-binding CsgD family transcriptional regulator
MVLTNGGTEVTTISFPDLVARAYEVASDASGLADLIRDTTDFFGAQQSAVAVWSPTNPDTFVPITYGMTREDLQTMFHQRGQSGTLFDRLNKLSSGETFAARARVQETPAGDSQHPTDAMHALAGFVVASGNNHFTIALFREQQNGEFNRADQETLQTLMSYYQRAIDLNRHFLRVVLEHRTAFNILENAPQGIFFLGQNGQVTYQNMDARMFFAVNDGLHLSDGFVQIDDQKVRREFYDFIDRMQSEDEADSHRAFITAIPRKSAAAPYQIIVSKLPCEAQRAALNDDESLATAVISDPEDIGDLKIDLLRSFFGLSAAEARLARALYKCDVLSDAAAALGISIHTARSELKKVFKKLDVNSQSALLKKLAIAIRET